jgi:hypothetical protein
VLPSMSGASSPPVHVRCTILCACAGDRLYGRLMAAMADVNDDDGNATTPIARLFAHATRGVAQPSALKGSSSSSSSGSSASTPPRSPALRELLEQCGRAKPSQVCVSLHVVMACHVTVQCSDHALRHCERTCSSSSRPTAIATNCKSCCRRRFDFE